MAENGPDVGELSQLMGQLLAVAPAAGAGDAPDELADEPAAQVSSRPTESRAQRRVGSQIALGMFHSAVRAPPRTWFLSRRGLLIFRFIS